MPYIGLIASTEAGHADLHAAVSHPEYQAEPVVTDQRQWSEDRRESLLRAARAAQGLRTDSSERSWATRLTSICVAQGGEPCCEGPAHWPAWESGVTYLLCRRESLVALDHGAHQGRQRLKPLLM